MENWTVIGLVNPSNEYSDCACTDYKGSIRTVDMLVDGAFPEGTKSSDLVGKVIECDYTIPDTLIAMNPRIKGSI